MFNSITFSVYRHDNCKCFYRKMGLFQPTETRGKIPGSEVACISSSKIPCLFKKQKNYTDIICVNHLTANKYYWC